MRYHTDEDRRDSFRDWLRLQFIRVDCYQRRGDRYLIREFVRFAEEQQADVDEVSLGRYIREHNPVLPTPDSCRELARALSIHPTEVLIEAGYLRTDDFFFTPAYQTAQAVPESAAGEAGQQPVESMRKTMNAIDRYTFLPESIRDQMKKAVEQHYATGVAEPAGADRVRRGAGVQHMDTGSGARSNDTVGERR